MFERPHRRAFRGKERQLRKRRAFVGSILALGALAAYDLDVGADSDPRIVRLEEDTNLDGYVNTADIEDDAVGAEAAAER